jgi:hypothetical protein
MTVIDAERLDFPKMTDCWFPAELDAALKSLTPNELQAAIDWVQYNIFEAAKATPTRSMNVTKAIRTFIPESPDWTGTPLQPLYDKTGKDDDRARKLYGNLVCRVGISRPETWWRWKQDVGGEHKSSTYRLESPM